MRSRIFALGMLLSSSGAAQSADVPLSNWTVPPYTQSSAGLTTMTDATPPRVFIGLVPCRIADTRGNGAPIQGGIFANGQTRTWTLTNACGIPVGANAVSANFTVTGSPAAPPGAILTAWPLGQAQPTASILNFQAGQTIANAAIVPLGIGGQVNVAVSHSTHVILDVNGYFADEIANQANFLELTNNAAGHPTASFVNLSSATNTSALYGQSGPHFPRLPYGAAGLRGESVGEYGVLGISQQEGVSGSLVDAAGNERAFGILGFASGLGYARGVHGRAVTSGSGVYGVAGSDPGLAAQGNGVAGVSTGPDQSGVAGYGQRGVSGTWFIAPNTFGAVGILGYSSTIGVFAGGGFSGTGAKYFVEPHPTDASKVIRYIALEGGEPGTYFRGRGRFQNGIARITVPEDFRLVTAEEGLTVQVTPIGGMATVGVLRMDLNEIVVQSSRNIEFSYMVNGIRRTHKNLPSPIAEGREYFPESADARMPSYLTETQQRLLIQNGTYREDGTVNMETARRLGWDRVWEERSRPAPQPPP
jgi:hypothetical protein